MAAASLRYSDSRAILGSELFDAVQSSRVLVVGAGGIGCELIKNMVMTGFGGGANGLIEVLDLDTIDLSNLNRQFLFQKQHVKRPKAVVARETALKFNPNVNITALHRNIKDAEFNVEYFSSFDFVLNALDNLDARRHVNKMCLAANIPLIESGTSGYVGQVQPIKKDLTECFDCTGKPVPKTFAVCTIRSTPSTAHHCIAWAKSYLLPQLFGADDEADGQELDDAEKNGENADEIQELRKEALAIKQLRSTLSAPGAAQRIFEKVYTTDILRLLKMEDMWKHRKAPHPLGWETLSQGLEARVEASDTAKGIKDQRELSLVDSFGIFVDSVERLSKRIDPASPISFDKDDDDTLDFVVAAANLRASAFDIESQTRFQVKEYAGNIIPAIATTNAIIAGALVLQSLHLLRSSWSLSRTIWLARQSSSSTTPTPLLSTKILSTSPLPGPNPQCSICRVVYLPLSFKPGTTLGEFVEDVVVGKLGWGGLISVQEGGRVLWETEDLEDNAERGLEELGVTEGKWLTVTDDDDPHYPVSFAVSSYLASDSEETFKVTPPTSIPMKEPPPLPAGDSDDDDDEVVVPATATAGGQKRTADEAELEVGTEMKKSKKDAKDDVVVVEEGDDDIVIVE